jgi:hypothetical protein
LAKRIVELRAGQTLTLSNPEVRITLEHKSGTRARLSVEAGDDTSIHDPSDEGMASLIASKGVSFKNPQ